MAINSLKFKTLPIPYLGILFYIFFAKEYNYQLFGTFFTINAELIPSIPNELLRIVFIE